MRLFLLCAFGYDSNHPDWNRQCLLPILVQTIAVVKIWQLIIV
jgi:hypothetical protein